MGQVGSICPSLILNLTCHAIFIEKQVPWADGLDRKMGSFTHIKGLHSHSFWLTLKHHALFPKKTCLRGRWARFSIKKMMDMPSLCLIFMSIGLT